MKLLTRRTAALCATIALAIAPMTGAYAHDPQMIALAELQAACDSGSIPPSDCATLGAAVTASFTGVERTGGGVSYEDARNENEGTHQYITVKVGPFYFAPRILEIDPGQVVHFLNESPIGGNTHIVSSSDWGGTNPALPIPGASSWGGGAFTSDRLAPGRTWDWPILADGSHPETGIRLGIDKVLIPYHCNLHGASQMNGYLILRTRQY